MRNNVQKLSAAAFCAASAAVLLPLQSAEAKTTAPAVISAASPDRSIEFNVFVPVRQDKRAQLEQLLQAQQDPKSALYHKWLTPQQFAERFGMSDDTVARLSSALSSMGLNVSHHYAQSMRCSARSAPV